MSLLDMRADGLSVAQSRHRLPAHQLLKLLSSCSDPANGPINHEDPSVWIMASKSGLAGLNIGNDVPKGRTHRLDQKQLFVKSIKRRSNRLSSSHVHHSS